MPPTGRWRSRCITMAPRRPKSFMPVTKRGSRAGSHSDEVDRCISTVPSPVANRVRWARPLRSPPPASSCERWGGVGGGGQSRPFRTRSNPPPLTPPHHSATLRGGRGTTAPCSPHEPNARLYTRGRRPVGGDNNDNPPPNDFFLRRHRPGRPRASARWRAIGRGILQGPPDQHADRRRRRRRL